MKAGVVLRLRSEKNKNGVVGLENDKKTGVLVERLLGVVAQARPSPEELRYAFKRVRELSGIKHPIRPSVLPKFYTPGEVYAMLEGANKLGTAYRLLLDVLVQTGLRIKELHDVDLRDVQADVQGGTVHVRRGKGGKERFIPISGRLLHEIRLFAGERRAGAIFTMSSGKPITVRTLQRWYDEIITVSGVEKKGGPHTARHTFAVICRARGIPLEEIQLMLGHEKLETTQIYARITYTPEQRGRYLQVFEGNTFSQ